MQSVAHARAGRRQRRAGLCAGGNCGLSFGGSSVAENTVYINGLNVTDFYNRVGFSSVPLRVLQGVPGQDRRLLGGVRPHHGRRDQRRHPLGHERVRFRHGNRRGNRSSLQSRSDDQFDAIGQPIHHRQLRRIRQHKRDRRMPRARSSRTSCSSSPCTKRATTSPRTPSDSGNTFNEATADDAFWGAKIDWQINDHNLLELLAFSDENEEVRDTYGFDLSGRTARRVRADALHRQRRHELGGDLHRLPHRQFP